MGTHLPGVETGFQAQPREILLSTAGVITVPVVVDGDKSIDGDSPTETYDLRPGWLMGQVTASKLWTPCKRTRASSSGTSATVPVDDAAAFRAGDVISVGSDANLTIASVNYASNQITVGSSFTFASGEAVVAQDGSQTARGILLDFVRLRNADNTDDLHKSATLLIAAFVDRDLVLGDLTAIRLDTSAKLAGIRFSDEHGM